MECLGIILSFISGGFLIYRGIEFIGKLYFLKAQNSKPLSTSLPDVSLIICSKGNASQLIKYLPKFLEQKGVKFEIILVLDFCNQIEEIKQLVRNHNNVELVDISGLNLPYLGKKKSLNLGISIAKYSWIATSDDDCYPSSPYWLSSMASEVANSNKKIILGFSPTIFYPKFLGQMARFESLITFIKYAQATLSGRGYMGMGRNMLFHKSLWSIDYLEQYGKLGASDDDTLVLSCIDKSEIGIRLNPVVYTYPPLSWKKWLNQKIRHLSSGLQMPKYTIIVLALDFLSCVVFVGSMWYWISFLAFCIWWAILFLIVVFIVTYPFFILCKFTNVSHKLQFKILPIWFIHSVAMLVLPFFSIWKK